MRVALVVLAFALSGCLSGDGIFDFSEEPFDGPWPQASDIRLQPGDPVVIDLGENRAACTSNFLFQTEDNETLYLGVAGHCFGDAGSAAIGVGAYRLNEDDTLTRIGTTAYSPFTTTSNDFGLIRLHNDIRAGVSPAMKFWGGPTGLDSGAVPGDQVVSYGASPSRSPSDPDNARQGRVLMQEGNVVRIAFDHPGIPGDSGSGIMDDSGRALCVLTLKLADPPISIFGETDDPTINSCVLLQPMITKARADGFPIQLVPWAEFTAPPPIP